MDEREFLNLVAKESSFLIAAHEMKTPLSIIRQLSLTLNDDEIELSNSEKSRILRQNGRRRFNRRFHPGNL